MFLKTHPEIYKSVNIYQLLIGSKMPGTVNFNPGITITLVFVQCPLNTLENLFYQYTP